MCIGCSEVVTEEIGALQQYSPTAVRATDRCLWTAEAFHHRSKCVKPCFQVGEHVINLFVKCIGAFAIVHQAVELATLLEGGAVGTAQSLLL